VSTTYGGSLLPRRPEPSANALRSRPGKPAFRLDDPRRPLSPTARRILTAARRVIMRGGLAKLSIQAVASEAGELKSTVAYHFGDKAGLISALTDSLIHDTDQSLLAAVESVPAGPQRVRMLIDTHRKIAGMDDYWRLVFGLLPEIANDSRLRKRFLELFEGYWAIQMESLGLPREEDACKMSRMIASLTLAVLEGLAFQRQLRPKDFDLDARFDLWLCMLEPYLRATFPAFETGSRACDDCRETESPGPARAAQSPPVAS